MWDQAAIVDQNVLHPKNNLNISPKDQLTNCFFLKKNKIFTLKKMINGWKFSNNLRSLTLEGHELMKAMCFSIGHISYIKMSQMGLFGYK